MRYLLVTFIPFARDADNNVLLDKLWAEDLRGLANSMGAITVAAPQYSATEIQSWGTGFDALCATDNITFTPLPVRRNRFDILHTPRLHRALKAAVDNADLVHTSNFFEPNLNLYHAHDCATRTGKKTLFVVAEDFYDMLSWEWVRTAPSPLHRWRRQRSLDNTHREVQHRVASASLTFLHTPAAVTRYRLNAANAIAIRQPVHEREDVIHEAELTQRLAASSPLKIVTASRMKSLKGLDLLLRAIALLESRGIPVQATLYGEGSQLPALQTLINTLQLQHCITLPGPIAQGAPLRAALNAADLFAMPHLTTDFGRAFFDAIAAALPVIAFRSPASQDTVRDNIDGTLVPNADPEALATAIARYHHDRRLLATHSEAARTRALDNTRTTWNNLRSSWIRELFPG